MQVRVLMLLLLRLLMVVRWCPSPRAVARAPRIAVRDAHFLRLSDAVGGRGGNRRRCTLCVCALCVCVCAETTVGGEVIGFVISKSKNETQRRAR